MAASSITEKDSAGVDKVIQTELIGSNHAPAGVIYANGVIVSTAAPLPVTSATGSTEATLAAIRTAVEAAQASLALLDNAIPSGTALHSVIDSGAVTISGSMSLDIPAGSTRRQSPRIRVTAATASTDVLTPGAGKKLAVGFLQLTWEGANACRISLWQGANADVTFSDSEPMLFDIDLDANANGGTIIAYPPGHEWQTDTADHEVHMTTSAAKIVTCVAVGHDV